VGKKTSLAKWQLRFYNPLHHRNVPRTCGERRAVQFCGNIYHLSSRSVFIMKKVVLASLLAVACAGPLALYGFSQAAAPAQAAGGVQMSAEEYAAYNNASTQTTPAAKATAFEAYLKAYPMSAVKADVLQQLLFAYASTGDNAKALDAADQLIALDPNNFRGFVFEANLRRAAADAITDPAAKQTALDAAADYAKKGLAAPKPKDMSDTDFTALKTAGYPVFYSVIGYAALNKKDSAAAVSAYMSELNSVPVAQTVAPGPQLQDTYYLATAYYTAMPPDYKGCTFYASRAAAYAPEPYKTTFNKLATYCYHKFHGPNDEGYDAVVAAAKTNLTIPDSLVIKPAPTPADIVANLIATTPDLATLAISDKEYVLQNGKPEDAAKVFDTIKGKSVEIPDALVIEATADSLKVAVSDDAVQGKLADFAFNFKEPLKTVPMVGEKVTLSGTYDSYTQTPILINMSDAELVVKKAPVKPKAPVHHAAAHH